MISIQMKHKLYPDVQKMCDKEQKMFRFMQFMKQILRPVSLDDLIV